MNSLEMNNSLNRIASILIISALLIATLILGKVVFVPAVFALLFTFALAPICSKLEDHGFNRIMAIIATFSLITLVVALTITLFSITFANIYQELPEIQYKIDSGLAKIENEVTTWTGYSSDNIQDRLKESQSKLLAPVWEFVQNSIGSSLATVGNLFLCLLYTFLMLYYRKGALSVLTHKLRWDRKLDRLQLVQKIKEVVQNYFQGLLIVMLILGVVNSLGLWFIGIEYPVFWGFLAGILVVIPYIGTTLGGFFPFLYALATTDTLWQPIAVIVMYFAVQQIEGNFITPNIVGSKIKVNALTLIIGMIIGGLIWGLAGIILALPIIAVTRTIFAHYESTSVLGDLMSDDLADQG
jgi:predicted PurR-regulated permease PerM